MPPTIRFPRAHASLTMAASPDVEADLLSEGSPLRSPSPEVGLGDSEMKTDAPAMLGDSESEDDDRRRTRRDKDDVVDGAGNGTANTEQKGRRNSAASGGRGEAGGRGGRGARGGDGGRGAPGSAGRGRGRAGREGVRGGGDSFPRDNSGDQYSNAHGDAPLHGGAYPTPPARGAPFDRRSGGSDQFQRQPPLPSGDYPRDVGNGRTYPNPPIVPPQRSNYPPPGGRFPDRAAPAELDDSLSIFLSRNYLARLVCADSFGPAPSNVDINQATTSPAYDPRFAVDALRASRGAIVRLGVGPGVFEIAELAGGALPDSQKSKAANVILRAFDGRTGRVFERPYPLGDMSNTTPTLREWDTYVLGCQTAAATNKGPPPPRVGDVEQVRDALDWLFRLDGDGSGRLYDMPLGRQGGYGGSTFGSSDYSVGQKRGPDVRGPDDYYNNAPDVQRQRMDPQQQNPPYSDFRHDSESKWVMDTRRNNGLVVGVKGENVRRVEQETGARVSCEKDKTTVVIIGAPESVAKARHLIEQTLRHANVSPSGFHGGGAPIPGNGSNGADHNGGGDLRSRLQGQPESQKPPACVEDTEPKATITSAAKLTSSNADADTVSAVVTCGGPNGFRRVAEHNGHSNIEMLTDCTKCQFERNADTFEITITCKGVESKIIDSVSVTSELIAEIANRTFTGMVSQRNVSYRFEAGIKALGLSKQAGEGCDITIDVGKDLGAVIGSKGNTIIRLQKESECVMTTDNKNKTVRIIGATIEQTKKGEQMVRDAIRAAAISFAKNPPSGGGRGGVGGRGRGRGRGRY